MLKPCRILSIDDDSGILTTLQNEMTKHGFEFQGFTNPEEAILELRKNPYDILLLDNIMYPLSGREVLEKIRVFNKDIYVVLLTGYLEEAPPLETLEQLDIQMYWEKEYDLSKLYLLLHGASKQIERERSNRKYEAGLGNILDTIPKMYKLLSVNEILSDILLGLLPVLDAKDAFILIEDKEQVLFENTDKVVIKGIGKYDKPPQNFFENFPHEIMEDIGLTRENKAVTVKQNYFISPLVNMENKSLGIIFAECEVNRVEVSLLDIYVNQIVASLNNTQLITLINNKNAELNSTFEELKISYIDTVEDLRISVDAKDVYTRGHSERVSFYSQMIGKGFDLSEEDVELLKVGGKFHDIGKIGTADDILLKPGKLDEEEFAEIKRHPVKGARILNAISMFRDIVPIVKFHHERFDGRGYPDGLKGEEIPFLARIVSVADAFDAITTDRQFRSKMPLQKAVEQLNIGKGTQFDAKIVEIFLDLLKDYDLWQTALLHTFELVELS